MAYPYDEYANVWYASIKSDRWAHCVLNYPNVKREEVGLWPRGDELTPLLWEGAAPGALITPEAAIAFATPYAVIPDGLAALLAADRQAEGGSVDRPAQRSALAPLWPKPKGRP